MRVAVFSTKYYEREYFSKFNRDNKHQLIFFESVLNRNTTNLTIGFDAVCVLITNIIDEKVVDKLSGIEYKSFDKLLQQSDII